MDRLALIALLLFGMPAFAGDLPANVKAYSGSSDPEWGKIYILSMSKQIVNGCNPAQFFHTPYQSVVSLEIDHYGRILSHSLKQSAGNTAFDDYAVQCITDAQPFGKLPEGHDKQKIDYHFMFRPK